VKLIQVDTDREHDHKRAMFDRDWQRLPFSLAYPIDAREILAPRSLRDMIAAAECLADGIPFIRIDFYEIDGKPRFGEMTFYPESGYARFDPASYDAIVGSWWRSRAQRSTTSAFTRVFDALRWCAGDPRSLRTPSPG
jgi:hypothetical protein